MSDRAAAVSCEVLAWPAEVRGDLAARLLESLDPGADPPRPADKSWTPAMTRVDLHHPRTLTWPVPPGSCWPPGSSS